MVSIEEAIKVFTNGIRISDIEEVSISECDGRILAKDISAVMNVPSYNRSAMDGYAVRSIDCMGGAPYVMTVVGENLAGESNDYEAKPKTAVRVMTGAYIPDGYDCVIKQEDTDYGMDKVEIRTDAKPWFNICRIAEDVSEGRLLFKTGTKLGPMHIGCIAMQGIDKVSVYKQARIAIISTGSELLEAGSPYEKGKIYNSTSYILESYIKRSGMICEGKYICPDDEKAFKDIIDKAADSADLIITTGGMSVGKRDFIPYVMDDIGAKLLFRGVDVQPGTPTGGYVYKDSHVLCLSGNPYAALVHFMIFYYEYLYGMYGVEEMRLARTKARFVGGFSKKVRGRRIVRGIHENDTVRVPDEKHESSVISNMVMCNCLIDMKKVPDDELVDIYILNL